MRQKIFVSGKKTERPPVKGADSGDDMKQRSFFLTAFLVCAGLVTGSMLAEMTAGIPWLRWLSYGLSFGTESPFVLDLQVIRLTFGISLSVTVSSLLFVALALLLGRLIAQK